MMVDRGCTGERWALNPRRSRRLLAVRGDEVDDEDLSPNVERSPYVIREGFNTLHLFSLLLCIMRTMECKICCNLALDITVLNCGHAFCKFCLADWFKTKEYCPCPTCSRFGVHPICSRCYPLDSVLGPCFRILSELYASEGVAFSRQQQHHQSCEPGTSTSFQPQKSARLDLQFIHRKSSILQYRRGVMESSACIVRSCPNKSLLQGVCDLGFGLRNTIEGFILMVIGSGLLAYALCVFGDTLEKMDFLSFRRICHVVILGHFLCYNPAVFRGSDRRIFWEQVIKIVSTDDEDTSVLKEVDVLRCLIRNKKLDLLSVKADAYELARCWKLKHKKGNEI